MKRIPRKHVPASAGGLADALFAKVQQRVLIDLMVVSDRLTYADRLSAQRR